MFDLCEWNFSDKESGRRKFCEILLAESNRKNIEEIDARYLKGMRFRYVKEMMDVVDYALLNVKAGR